MSPVTYFLQECPTCGRKLQIRVEYLGRWVVCQHCHGQLQAQDDATGDGRGSAGWLLRRAEELLAVPGRERLAVD